VNGGHQPHAAATTGAFQDVNGPHSFHQFGPGIVPSFSRFYFFLRLLRMYAYGLTARDVPRGAFRRHRDDLRPPFRGGTKNPIEPHEMHTGRRH
jgi:hypothetical protein